MLLGTVARAARQTYPDLVTRDLPESAHRSGELNAPTHGWCVAPPGLSRRAGRSVVGSRPSACAIRLMAELRPIRLLASVVIVLLLAAAACGGQDPSPSEAAPAPAAAVDSTQASEPPAEPLPPAESNAPEVAEETVDSPSPAPEPVETVDSTPATSQSAQPQGVSFRREEVVFSNGDIVLAGELTLPEGDGPHAAVVLISGSGDQDRDSDSGGFRLFAVLADHLAGAGVASLRFDDRGVGGSTGDGLQATLQDRAGDVEAAVDVLRSRDDIDAGGTGLVGHSEGGIVAPLVANRTDSVAFVVLLAAPAVPAGEILAAQQLELFEESGAAAEQVEQFRALQQLVFGAVATGQGWDEVEATMRILVQQQFEALPEQTREAIPDENALVDSIVAEELATWQSPWFESFFEYDPRPAIVALDVPVIALYGELDTQVPAASNSTAMSEAITESSVPSHTIATIFSANHLFQEAVTGSVNEYARLKREFAPDFLAILTEWLTDVSGV